MKIVMLVIDALRADSLSCYGYRRKTSPGIDALVGEGILFENAYTQANWTNPSLYSLLTGLYPSRHGVENFDQNLGDSVVTLSGLLGGFGYRTVLFSNYHVLLDRNRLGKHFQAVRHFDIDLRAGDLRQEIEAAAKSDLFCFVHAVQYVHEPYCAPPSEVARFWDGAVPARKIIRVLTREAGLNEESMRDALRSVNLRRERLDRREIAYLKACYDAGIRHVDGRLKELFDFLHSVQDEVILVITADHGQGFMEHGFFGHGLNLHEELIRVPLLFWMNRSRPGLRLKSVAQLIDVFPTLLELIGRPGPPSLDGASLAGCLRGVEEAGRRAICEGDPFVAFIRARRKLISSTYRLIKKPEGIRRLGKLLRERRFRRLLLHLYSLFPAALYDLSADPGETRNLKRRKPAEYREMLKCLREWRQEVSSAPPEVTTRELDDERAIEQLKSLGYL